MNLCDIMVCQEIVLLDDEGFFLGDISNDFEHNLIPSKPPKSEFGDGRPS